MTATLSRETAGVPTPPVRIVHLGLGAFHRAHQAWFTAQATDAAEWGIAAFTGRSPAAAVALAAQDHLYTLTRRGADGDRTEVVGSIVEAHRGDDLARLADLFADPRVAVVTLTITEAGYRLLPDGLPDVADPVLAADIENLRDALAHRDPLGEVAANSALGRLLLGLEIRRRAGAGPIAIVPCDNVPDNGRWLRTGLIATAGMVDDLLAGWVAEQVSVVSTSVDRITPRLSEADAAWALESRGDACPVVAEPFADWTLEGDFPAGRPDWESAGARFVDDIEPWEQRKLWLLNGAHSILASAGPLRGHETVAEAIADPACRDLVERYWGEAVALLPEGIEHADYRGALIDRFANPRIVHRLEQIAADAATKTRYRAATVAERTLDAGRVPDASLEAVAAWVAGVIAGHRAPDSQDDLIDQALAADDPVARLLEVVSPRLAGDAASLEAVRSRVAALRAADPVASAT
ncbi:mannitol dehydrogenase [Agromyces rhizosphaerae]|uniref:Mannitol dehydrogenase n=1 Tax=Agromyces rhizosphaerae TaxID=88374 RepID=A0A9W6CXH1_9MICO|nr:mannitol dehydrogenase family protein [Agromyces rhizosphaerae]GLI27816.1 mannitol dehydrogenase [Agromyces rhizosphaerae]